jgi:hypothetical protein
VGGHYDATAESWEEFEDFGIDGVRGHVFYPLCGPKGEKKAFFAKPDGLAKGKSRLFTERSQFFGFWLLCYGDGGFEKTNQF